MSKKQLLLYTLSILLLFHFSAQTETKLTGTPISSDYSSPSIVNPFDGDMNTEFKSSLSSLGWVGLKLDSKYQITKIGYAVKTTDKSDFLLGVFEGSNDVSFVETYPLSMILDGTPNQLNYIEIKVTKKFKYIRYVGPAKKYCQISLLEIYTDEDKEAEEDKYFYQPTNIPLISIHIEDSIEPFDKNNYHDCHILITDKNQKNAEATAKIKVRGNATQRLEKKPYRLKFDSKISPLSLSAKAKSWALLANHSDKTLLRNSLALQISKLFEMKWTPECEMVDLILNGEYKGNYGLCDKVETHKGRVEITEMDDTCVKEPEVTGGYFFTADAYAQQEGTYHKTTKGIIYTFKDPEESDIVKEQLDYFTNYFNVLEAEGYNNTVDKIDIETFAKYLLIEDLSGNGEAYWSCYMTKERSDDKFYFGPVWDFDLGFDNDMRVYPTLEKKDFIFKYGTSAGTMKTFAQTVLANEDVIQGVKKVWGDYKKEKVTKTVLLNYLDEQFKNIDESQKLNFIRWDILNKQVLLNPVVRGSYEAEANYLREYIQKRYDILDEVVEKLNVESAKAEVKNEHKFGPHHH